MFNIAKTKRTKILLNGSNLRNSNLEKSHKTAVKFRFNNVRQRMNTYKRYWDRIMRMIEEGRFKREKSALNNMGGPSLPPAGRGAAGKDEGDGSRAVYDAWKKAQKDLGRASDVDFDRFQAKLDAQRQAQMKKFGWSDVNYSVRIKDGKVALVFQHQLLRALVSLDDPAAPELAPTVPEVDIAAVLAHAATAAPAEPEDQQVSDRDAARGLLNLLIEREGLEIEEGHELEELVPGTVSVLAMPARPEAQASALASWLLDQPAVADLYVDDEDLAGILEQW